MGEVVNLRTARKRRLRDERDAAAAENRVRHGRTGPEKRADRAERERAARTHDGRLLDRRDRLDQGDDDGA